jgi:hypothetical protein
MQNYQKNNETTAGIRLRENIANLMLRLPKKWSGEEHLDLEV